MTQDAFKNQMLSSHEYYQPKRWEGKPWGYKFKYMVANYPELAMSGLLFLVTPLIVYYKYSTYEGSKREALKKFKHRYTVVRDDDPNIVEIMKEKELGREYFPKY